MVKDSKKLKFDALDETNSVVWIRRVQDHMFGKKLLDYYKHAMAEDDDTAAEVQLPADDAAATAVKDKLEELWAFLNEHLTADIYKLTMEPDAVDYGDPVSLLVFLRKHWRSKTPFDRDLLRQQFNNFNFEEHKNMDVFIANFKQHVNTMKEYNVGMVQHDEDVLHRLKQVLPPAYSDYVKIIDATNLNLGAAYAYLKKIAKNDQTLPGSTNPVAATKRRDAAHATATTPDDNTSNSVNANASEELCRNFAQTGHCRNGADCKYVHREDAKNGRPKCNHCRSGKPGHIEAKCWNKHPELIPHKESDSAAPAPASTAAAPAALISLEDLTFVTVEEIGIGAADTTANLKLPHVENLQLPMLIDSLATCVVVQDSSRVTNLRPANINIKVGGGILHCAEIGDFDYYQEIEGGFVLNKTIARVMPGFGFDILPESIYLEAGCAVSKFGDSMVATKGEQQVLQGRKLPQPDVYLYYAAVTPITIGAQHHQLPLLTKLPLSSMGVVNAAASASAQATNFPVSSEDPVSAAFPSTESQAAAAATSIQAAVPAATPTPAPGTANSVFPAPSPGKLLSTPGTAAPAFPAPSPGEDFSDSFRTNQSSTKLDYPLFDGAATPPCYTGDAALHYEDYELYGHGACDVEGGAHQLFRAYDPGGPSSASRVRLHQLQPD